VRPWLADPILRRVLAVWLLAVALTGALVLGLPDTVGVLDGAALGGAWILPALIAVTCLGELIVVRLRHGGTEESLTLCEAAIIVDVLLLPPREALVAAVVGLLIASVIQRRPLMKLAFNLGTYTAASAAMIVVVHVIGGTPQALTVGVVVGVLVGTYVFTAINLLCLAEVLAVVNEVSAWQVLRSQAGLSAYMAAGTVATGLPAAVMVLSEPLLLPFMAMPVLALTFAYRAAAQETDERERSAVLLRLSHALAERDDVVRRFLAIVREAFKADVAVVALDAVDMTFAVDAEAPDELLAEPMSEFVRTLTHSGEPALVSAGLPPGIHQVITVPLEAGGRRYGVAGIAVRRRRPGLSARDVTVLASLGNALAAAMRGAERHDELLEETSKLHAIVEQSTEGILMVDGDGAVQMWSHSLAALTGIASGDAAGRSLRELLDVPDPAERALLLAVRPDRPAAVVQLTIRRADGELRRLRLAHSAVFADGLLLRDVVVVRDLTREHRTERLKSDFIATVSHELRTPLTPIIGYVDLLRSRGERMTPEKRRASLDVVADRASHLLRLVEDLLLASRIGDTEEDLAVEVSTSVHDFVPIVRQVATDRATSRVQLDLPDTPVGVHCDPGRALQVVSNLVGNALKYSPEAEDVHVTMRRDDERVYIDVEDHGLGIPSDQLAQIFEKFHRVEDPMTMSTSGTGLGLFIARRLALAMGGDITVTSTLNVGSVFTLTLRAGAADVVT
jgi:PAS domain S-box-containing protein